MAVKQPTAKDLAEYLDRAVSTINSYTALKRRLMILGLWKLKELEAGEIFEGEKMTKRDRTRIKALLAKIEAEHKDAIEKSKEKSYNF